MVILFLLIFYYFFSTLFYIDESLWFLKLYFWFIHFGAIFFSYPSKVISLSMWWAFLCLGLDYSCCTKALWFEGRRVKTGLTETHLRLACAQVGPFLCWHALARVLSMSHAHGRKDCYKMLYQENNTAG